MYTWGLQVSEHSGCVGVESVVSPCTVTSYSIWRVQFSALAFSSESVSSWDALLTSWPFTFRMRSPTFKTPFLGREGGRKRREREGEGKEGEVGKGERKKRRRNEKQEEEEEEEEGR